MSLHRADDTISVPYVAGEHALLITVAGDDAEQLAVALRKRVRAPRRDELARVRARVVDFATPRRLWPFSRWGQPGRRTNFQETAPATLILCEFAETRMARAVQNALNHAHSASGCLLASCGINGGIHGNPACDEGKCDAPMRHIRRSTPRRSLRSTRSTFGRGTCPKARRSRLRATASTSGSRVSAVARAARSRWHIHDSRDVTRVSRLRGHLQYDGTTSLGGMTITRRPEARAVSREQSRAPRCARPRPAHDSHRVYGPEPQVVRAVGNTGTPRQQDRFADGWRGGVGAWVRRSAACHEDDPPLDVVVGIAVRARSRSVDASDRSTADRRKHDHQLLDRSPATKRVIVAQFLGQDGVLQSLNVDSRLQSPRQHQERQLRIHGPSERNVGNVHMATRTFVFGERIRDFHQHTASRKFDTEPPHESFIAPYNADLTRWPIGVELEHASLPPEVHRDR